MTGPIFIYSANKILSKVVERWLNYRQFSSQLFPSMAQLSKSVMAANNVNAVIILVNAPFSSEELSYLCSISDYLRQKGRLIVVAPQIDIPEKVTCEYIRLKESDNSLEIFAGLQSMISRPQSK